MKRRMGLAGKIGLLFYGITLVLVLALAGMLYGYFHWNIETSLVSTMSTAVGTNVQAAEGLVARIELYMAMPTAEENDFLDVLLSYDGTLFPAYPQFQHIKLFLKANLELAFGGAVNNCVAMFVVDDSMPMASIFASESPRFLTGISNTVTGMNAYLSRDTLFESLPWYQDALAAGGDTIWFVDEANPRMLMAAKRIEKAQLMGTRVQKFDMGVLVISFDASWMRRQLTTGALTENSRVLLVDDEYRVVYEGNALPGDAEAARAAVGAGGAVAATPVGDASDYIWINPIAEGLNMVTLIPHADIARLTGVTLRIVYIAAAFLLAAGLIIVLAVSRIVVLPIRRLSTHMARPGGELMPIDASGAPRDEVGALYVNFNAQTERIARLLEDVKRSEQAKKVAELEKLHAQMNPHFVYNTLDTVCCKALMRGEDEIATMLSALVNIMRYNLKDSDQAVPLVRAMEIVDAYMRIQQVRSAGATQLEKRISEEAMGAFVPKMSIQPLVENAVLHGSKAPHIVVEAAVQDGILTIRVLDDGENADVERINAHIAGEIDFSGKSTGFGTRNIDGQVRMTFGDEFGLRYQKTEDGWTEARLTMPAVYAGEAAAMAEAGRA